MNYIGIVANYADFGIIICFALVMIILIRTSNKTDDEFEKWLLLNSTKSIRGYYFFNDDKSGRLYSKTELRNFFYQSEK